MSDHEVVKFPVVQRSKRISPEMYGDFLRAEAKFARENHRYARSLYNHLAKISEVLNRAAGPVSAEHRNELINLATTELREAVARGFREIDDAPDPAIYEE